MELIESPTSSDSAHTPLQDEHVGCEVSEEIPVNIEIGVNEEMIEEQLDYEEFIENNELPKPESEAEEGEYDSGDDNDVVLCENEDKKSLENGELNSDDEATISKPPIRNFSHEAKDDDVLSKGDGELAEGELKAEEEEIPIEETPWERGLRLARERRELAKLKKVQEKDKLKEKQLHINLDHIEEVEPISKPQIEKNYEMNQQLLKAMQPIVILPEEPRLNEMIMEYYLAESDYQHRPRFIPSRLYTLDPWEVEEWKRELDMMKLESEKGKIASNKHKRISGGNPAKRMGRRGSVSSSVSSRSSSLSDGGKGGVLNQSTRQYEFQTSQYALSRSKPVLDKFNKPNINESVNKLHLHRGKRDLPPEFKNRVISSSRSSSRSSSGSHSSSSGSSSSSRSTSSPRRISPKKQHRAVHAAGAVQKTSAVPTFRTIKKPALGRARSDSSGSSKSSDSSSTSSDSSSSRSSNSSADSKTKTTRKNKTDKQFISSWFTKTPQNPLEATVVQESGARRSGAAASKSGAALQVNGDGDNDQTMSDAVGSGHLPAVQSIFDNDSQLPSVGTRPGVKLKLVSRPKPVILPTQQTGASKSTKTTAGKDKSSKKQTTPSKLNETSIPIMGTSNIFNNSKSIFSSMTTSSNAISSSASKTASSDLQLSQSTKDSTLKSNLAATQLEMQQEFLRNYKDKIAIYRSQLSYQQQNPMSGQHPSTLTHNQPPPIKGPITVMSVTSKKTGPPKTQVKVTDRYSQHEEHSRRYNNNNNHHHHHHSPGNYRNNDFRDNTTSGTNSNNNNNNSNSFGGNRNRHESRNRSRSFDNDRTDWGRSRGGGGGDRDYHGRSNRNYDGAATRDYNDSGKYRQPADSYNRSARTNEYSNDKFGGGNNNRSSYNNNSNNDNSGTNKYRDQHDNTRNRYDAPSSGVAGRHDYDRSNRFEREDDRPRRADDRSNNNLGGGSRGGGRDYNRYNKDSFSREDRPRGDRYHRDSDRDYEDRFSENSAIDKRPGGGGGESDKHREDKFESSKPRPRNLDRDSLTDSSATNLDNSNKPAAAMATLPSVPKEKRREELLKQLKAVEDAIAKKKAKIDK